MKKPFAVTLDVGSSLRNKTGSWRVERPVYIDRMPPCNHGCPAGEDIQQWLYRTEEGDYEDAWRVLMQDNPFPAVMGRVCYHPCETACNRAELDSAVGINSVERFLGDQAIKHGWRIDPGPDTGKRVLVVGAGPSGLAAAYHLRRLGHDVTIVESASLPGGMMRFGIPKYRLPRDVLDAEIERITWMGTKIEFNHTVTDLAGELALGKFDAAFLATGAHIGKRAYIPAGDSSHILDAVSLLHGLEVDERPQLGRRVAVYGGGDTAMDAARTARRLGATEAIVVYRRTRERMPAHDVEVEEALEEGVTMRWLSTVAHANSGKLRIEKMELDEKGFPQPTGVFEELEADTLILALGQDADMAFLDNLSGIARHDGLLEVDANMMTGHDGVFAGGDMVPSDRTVTVAVGHGKKVAHSIDRWLRGVKFYEQTKHELASFSMLNTWYYSDAPKTMRTRLDLVRRQSTFDEVVQSLDASTALFEARRCMSCGNCFECDNCYGVCPDNAVTKLGPGKRYAFNYDYCKGCGLCMTECPAGAIRMELETI
jgi:2-oxoacid:acceptor oxidoreductase delta subunit (pyruvate/2-ketoisovalerate family)